MPALPHPFTLASLRTWAKSEIDSGRPRWKVHGQLATAFSGSSELKELEALTKVMGSIEDTLVDRNSKGVAFERAGKIERAIQLYEANVADEFDGSHPYNRLRIIYKSRDDYSNAIRVCNAYLSVASNDPKTIEQVRSEIGKLSAKLASATSKGTPCSDG